MFQTKVTKYKKMTKIELKLIKYCKISAKINTVIKKNKLPSLG